MYAILYAMRLRDKNYHVNQFKKVFLFKFLTFGQDLVWKREIFN
jgi:hypothetical protein